MDVNLVSGIEGGIWELGAEKDLGRKKPYVAGEIAFNIYTFHKMLLRRSVNL
jgi:hypothetical protein